MPQVWDRTRGHLLIVGRGDERSDLEALVQDLDLAHCVHFLGDVPREDLPALYRAVDLFAIASICEVQSLPVLEAAASGLPCVAADAVALPELVHDGENGYLVPPGDPEAMARALIDVLTDPDLAVHMGRESLAIAKPHAEIHTFNRYEMLYQELVRSSTAVPA
jgi:glycosyltransferase involved in cell wall biosynthesis